MDEVRIFTSLNGEYSLHDYKTANITEKHASTK